MKKWTQWLSGASAALALAAAPFAHAETRLQGAGSTFIQPIVQSWIAKFQETHTDVKMGYEGNGSGGGIKGITENTVDFAASDAPLSKAELAKANAAAGGDIIELPAVAGAVVVAYNIPGFKGTLKLDGPTIADIFQGKVTNWNDGKIAALNPGVTFPDQQITVAFRTDASGTNYIFTNYLCTQSDSFREEIGAGKAVEWKAAQRQGGKGSQGVAAILSQTPGAIGYVEEIFADSNSIPSALIKNKDGEFVQASSQSVAAAGESALEKMKSEPTGMAVNIWSLAGKEVYPISSFTYILIHKDLSYVKDMEKAKVLAEFLRWALADGEKMAPDLHYAPLSDGVQKKVAEALDGLTFDGKPLK